jgi:hypothetical protein
MQGIGLIVLTIGILLAPILVRNHAITGVYWLDNPVTSTGVSHFVTVGTDVDVDTSLLDDEEAIINRNFTVLFSALTENLGQMAHFISDHFLRNIISTALIIPVRLGNGVPWIDLFRMRAPFWAEVYTEPNLINSIVLIVNLTIISLGFAALWKRKPILPLMLLLTYLVYNLSSSLVRLSGWRFVQPVDWFLYIFFISGVVEIIGWCFSKIPGFQPSINLPYWYIPDNSLLFEGTIRGKVIISGLLFFLACGFIPLRETLFPKYIPEYEKYTVCDEVSSYILGSEYQEWDEKMTEFCKSGTASVYKGFGFYPRFFDEGEGYYDRSRDKFYGEQDYSRLVFRIVGELNGKIYIKTEKPATGFSDGDLVYAIVENENRVGAHVVVIPGARPEVIIASDILSGERPFITNK